MRKWICLLPIFMVTWFLATDRLTGQTWALSLGGSGAEWVTNEGSAVEQTADGGFIVWGYTDSFGLGTLTYWAIKLDSAGGIDWQRAYPGTYSAYVGSIIEIVGGGYVAVGRGGLNAGEAGLRILRLDPAGNISWERVFGGPLVGDEAYSVQETSTQHLIIAGTTLTFGGSGGADIYVLKLDGSGNLVWQRTYGGTAGGVGDSIREATNGDYLVAGWTASFGAGLQDYWVLRLDKNTGGVIWQKTFGGTSTDKLFSMRETSANGTILAGETSSFGPGTGALWVLNLDAAGDIIWQKAYGGPGGELGGSIQQTADGGFILAGETDSFGAGSEDLLVLKLNGSGDISWQKTYGGVDAEQSAHIKQTSDGGFILASGTPSFGAGGEDLWVLRLDSNGDMNPSCPVVGVASATVTIPSPVIGITTVSAVDPLAPPNVPSTTPVPTSVIPDVICPTPPCSTLPYLCREDACPGPFWVSLPADTCVTSVEELCAMVSTATVVRQKFSDASSEYRFECGVASSCTSPSGSTVPEPGNCTTDCFCIDPGEGYEVEASGGIHFQIYGQDAEVSINAVANESYLVSVPKDTPLTTASDVVDQVRLGVGAGATVTVARRDPCTQAIVLHHSDSLFDDFTLRQGEAVLVESETGGSFFLPIGVSTPTSSCVTIDSYAANKYCINGTSTVQSYSWWVDNNNNTVVDSPPEPLVLDAGGVSPLGASAVQLAEMFSKSINDNPTTLDIKADWTGQNCFVTYVGGGGSPGPLWVGVVGQMPDCKIGSAGCTYNPTIILANPPKLVNVPSLTRWGLVGALVVILSAATYLIRRRHSTRAHVRHR